MRRSADRGSHGEVEEVEEEEEGATGGARAFINFFVRADTVAAGWHEQQQGQQRRVFSKPGAGDVRPPGRSARTLAPTSPPPCSTRCCRSSSWTSADRHGRRERERRRKEVRLTCGPPGIL